MFEKATQAALQQKKKKKKACNILWTMKETINENDYCDIDIVFSDIFYYSLSLPIIVWL